jgi:hypothetical protein
MIQVGNVLQTIIDVLKDMVATIINLISEYLFYIVIVIGLVILYFVLTRTIFRGTVYRTSQKEPIYVLTMSGRERSLEYLEKFGEIKGVEAQIINYLRENENITKKRLEKTFGTAPVRSLVKKGMIKIV